MGESVAAHTSIYSRSFVGSLAQLGFFGTTVENSVADACPESDSRDS